MSHYTKKYKSTGKSSSKMLLTLQKETYIYHSFGNDNNLLNELVFYISYIQGVYSRVFGLPSYNLVMFDTNL
jgi:hypothetical protein